MKCHKLLQSMIAVVMTLLLLTGCGPLATVKTSAGDLNITKVQFTDKFPLDCAKNNPGCSQAQSGYKILVVRMENKQGEDIESLYAAIPDGIYVVADNDAQTDSFASQYVVSPGTIFLAFAVKDSEQNFKLVWPGQPITDLGQ